MFLIDAEGILVFCNEAAELLLGKSYGEIGSIAANEFGAMLELGNLDGTPMRRAIRRQAWPSTNANPSTESCWPLPSMAPAIRSKSPRHSSAMSARCTAC